jgi:hypothetical protein
MDHAANFLHHVPMERARSQHRTGHKYIVIVVASLAAGPMAGLAAPRATDPDWPCPQIKVAEVSLAAVWTGPELDPANGGWRDDAAAAALVQRIAPRRVPLEDAQASVRDFAKDAGDRRQAKLKDLLVGLFITLGQERAAVLAGLDRFGRRQKELAARIRTENEKLRALQSTPAADPAALAQATQQVTWDVEVFQDRRQAISAACAVAGKIEQRLFMLARTIQDALE